MTFWSYMLHCRGGAFYAGHTDNLEHRIAQHKSGAIPGFTRDYAPVELVWSQEFPTRLEALESERRIKGWSRAKKLALIRGDWATIATLAKGKDGPSTSSGRTDDNSAPRSNPVRAELVEAPLLPPRRSNP
ncbi:MAG TPA: GIY-YIG nuclease family protein [Sphingomonas sp.]|nr:GIY-YIG nuclease family protein [Sphingomonas sp.]